MGRLVGGLSLSSPLSGPSLPFPFQDGESDTASTGTATPSKESGWGNVWQASAFPVSLFLVGLSWVEVGVGGRERSQSFNKVSWRLIYQKGR